MVASRPFRRALSRTVAGVLPAVWHQALWRLVVLRRTRRTFAALGVRAAFEQIYSQNLWGGTPGSFHSGTGSSLTVAAPYIECVRKFIAENGIRSVADLGCGDFQVGQQITQPGLRYVGVDIVQPLIEHNQARFGHSSVRFECRDLITDRLPLAELALVRQVLQHLSNEQILRVIRNIACYDRVLVTEHVPIGGHVQPNLDKPHGPDTRLYDGSGVFLDRAPFSLETTVLLETPLAPQEVLRTVLIERRSDAG